MTNVDLKNQIVKYLIKNNVSLLELKQAFDAKKVPPEEFNQAIFDLLVDKQIICTLDGVEPQLLKLGEWIDRQNDEILEKFFFSDNVEGPTSRENLLLVKERMKNRETLEEDKFKDIYTQYKFDLESFVGILEQTESTYRYLSIVYKKGKINWSEIRKDDTVDKKIIDNALKMIERKGFYIDSCFVEFSAEAVLCYLLKQHENGISSKYLYDEYMKFLKEEEPLPRGLEIKFNQFNQIIKNSKDIIFGASNTLRYRNFSERKDSQLIKKLRLNQYRNQYLSAEIIYQNSKEELLKNDVRDEFELINIMKMQPNICEEYNIKFFKSPFISVGNADPVEQIKKLLNELSPVSGDELAKVYEKRYGVKANTVKVKLLKEISQYSRNGIYDTKTKILTEKQYVAISSKLNKPWYFVSDVEHIFRSHIRKLYKEYMSVQNLLQLGYKKTSTIIYSSNYSSLIDCLSQTEWKEGTFAVSDLLWEIPQIYNALQNKMSDLEIIEYSPQKFIRLSHLKRNNIHKKDLRFFMEEVCQCVGNEEFFTMKYLNQKGHVFKLESFGFDDIFYASVLKQSNKIQCKKISNNYLFRKSKKEFAIIDFVISIVCQYKSIDIFDLIYLFENRYGVTLTPIYVRNIVNDSDLHYDNISGKIFKSYGEYFEHI